MLTVELYKLKEENNFIDFYKKISKFIPDLKNFIAIKLKIAENQGLIDKGFYEANGILDEVYMEVFKNFTNDLNIKQLRKILFTNTLRNINKKSETEHQWMNKITIDSILKEELDLLNEDYTIDAGGDFILDEELDDISYKQKSFKPTHFILDDSMEKQLAIKLDIDYESKALDRQSNLFGNFFNTIPPVSRTIIELYVFGSQTTSEIAEILVVDEDIVISIINKIKERFKLI